MKFYVYEWYNIDTNEVFYVGKGCKNRYKEVKKRNKKFLEYYENNNVNVRIVKFFDDEDEAFAYEKELTDRYREKNQCKCNLIDGGYGGFSKIWNDEARDYYSKNNVMKRPEQRQRMSENNPMKNPEIAKKVGLAHGRKIQIGKTTYSSLQEAAIKYDRSPSTISSWCKKGINPNGEKCKYLEKQKLKRKNQKVIIKIKPVIIDDIYYNSIAEAAEAINCNKTTLARHLRSGNKIYKGHKIEYANQQPS